MESQIKIIFPLTSKWSSYINRFSYRVNIDFEEGFQEALLLEWELQRKISDLRYRENYFRKVLRYRLISIRNEELKGSIRGYTRGQYDWRNRELVNTVCVNGKGNDEDILDNFIKVRSFDEMYFEEWVAHISYMLLEIDSVACEMFLLRIKEDLRWKVMKEYRFVGIPFNKFYSKVKLIKSIVEREIRY